MKSRGVARGERCGAFHVLKGVRQPLKHAHEGGELTSRLENPSATAPASAEGRSCRIRLRSVADDATYRKEIALQRCLESAFALHKVVNSYELPPEDRTSDLDRLARLSDTYPEYRKNSFEKAETRRFRIRFDAL